MRCWINTVSKSHVLIGKKQGIIQAGHGKESPLKKLSKNDTVIFYSPKTSLDNGKPLQKFTAAAKIADDKIYKVEISDNFKPFRRKAEYSNFNEVEIKPLINELGFIKNKKSWGFYFRFGLFEINLDDYKLIIASSKRKNFKE